MKTFVFGCVNNGAQAALDCVPKVSEVVTNCVFSLGVLCFPVGLQTASMTLDATKKSMDAAMKQSQLNCQINCQVNEEQELCDEWVSIGSDGYTVCNL